ncbi:MAG: hypothetical protein ACO25B_12255 [Chitinophagaceae bacterium]
MNPRINQLVKSLLQKDSLDQCTLPELEQFAERHPYFGAAQLLLTKKMQTENPEQYEQQLQKTFLFFHNPLWVEHLLNDNGQATVSRAVTEKTLQTEHKEPETNHKSVPETINVSREAEQTAEPQSIAPDDNEKTGIPDSGHSVFPGNSGSTGEIESPAPEFSIPELKVQPPSPKSGGEELLFEPYHTVDYFASQGIRFKEEEKPQDKFGRQLKSFTEWLKTMKRLPVSEIAEAASEPASEKKVEEMAEKSLQDREILTEAMAEVWEKQGNTLKAIEIYSKLSLLEPAKSTYFAAKIEVLKKLI